MYLKQVLSLFILTFITNSHQSVLISNSGRIVHGSDAAAGQFPFFASIIARTVAGAEILCGGSLIRTEWIYTAAQCVQGYATFEIGLGSTSLKGPLVTRSSEAARAHVNPLYNPNTLYQDVALIHINAVTLSNTIQTIDLPWWIYDYDDFFVNLNTQAIGFGQLANGTHPDTLQFVDIVTIPTSECRGIYGTNYIGTDKICGRGLDIKQNICYGDQGGPLIYKNATTTFLIGVASFWSVLPCEYGHPSAYTRAESNLKFVEYVIGWRGD